MFLSKPKSERTAREPFNALASIWRLFAGLGFLLLRVSIFLLLSFSVVVVAGALAPRGMGAIDRRLDLLFAVNPGSIPWAASAFLLWGVVAWLLAGYVARRFRKPRTGETDLVAENGFWRVLGNALYPVIATALFLALALQTTGLILEGPRTAVESATSPFAYGVVQATVFEDGSAQCFLDFENAPCTFYLRDDPKFNEYLNEPDSRVISFGDLEGNGSDFVYVYSLTGRILSGKFGDMNSVEVNP